MPKVDIFTTSGEKKGTASFDFDKPVSDILISSVARAALANKRQVIAKTKTRAEVRGGGKKPWRQKGTGRARHGSIRSPIWRGGGVTFGPTSARNFSKRINRRQKSLVLARIIADKIEAGHLKILENIKLKEGKTREALHFLSSLGIDGPTLIVLDREAIESGESKTIYLASRNLPLIEIIAVDKMNAYMVLKYDWLIITKKAFEELKRRFEGILK